MSIDFFQQLMSHVRNFSYSVSFFFADKINQSAICLGTTCAYIAAKYEEMYPPALEEFSFITDNTYETKHILRMEQIVMKVNFI